MAMGLLGHKLAQVGQAATIVSAGLLQSGQPASENGVATLRDRGIDISHHRSTQMTREHVSGADLIIAMERRHLREAVVLDPSSFAIAFTLKELARRAEAIGPRLESESVDAWLRRASAGRRPADLMGVAPDDDVEDPIGRPKREYEKTADELDALLDRVVNSLFPVPVSPISDPH